MSEPYQAGAASLFASAARNVTVLNERRCTCVPQTNLVIRAKAECGCGVTGEHSHCFLCGGVVGIPAHWVERGQA